jgi:tRNA A37 threonylcarbamoyladenosine dehydratase
MEDRTAPPTDAIAPFSVPEQAEPLDVPDRARRFGGIARLYGDIGAQRLAQAHVAVIGIGGVGSWAAEALARTAVGRLTLIDLDNVAESNTNRQIHALDGNYGKAKVDAMAERIALIDPACVVQTIEDFAEPDNFAQLLGDGFDYIIDAIDNTRTKTALLAWCAERGQKIITVGSAGGQIDPTRIRIDDLSRTIQDPLLAKVRGNLRKMHRFPRDPKARFGIPAVYSDEPLRYPQADDVCEIDGVGVAGQAMSESTESVASSEGAARTNGPTGLNCAGFGSSMVVTASFGLAAASHVLNAIVATPPLST